MKRYLVILALLAACTDVYDYDPASAGQPEGSERAPRGKTTTQFLRGIYADLLGRTPESYEIVIKFQGTEVFRFTADEEALLGVPEKSAVQPREYIRDQFRKLLGREPNTYELEAFAAEWDKDPAVGPRTVIRAIIASREYQSQ